MENAKRKPGRPKTNKNSGIVADNRGIVFEPTDTNNVVEMVYCTSIFKQILGLIKSYEINDLYITFEKDKIIFYNSNANKIFKIVTDARKISLYYCKEPLTILLNSKCLSDIFTGLTKQDHKITFLMTNHGFVESDNRLQILIYNPEFCNTNRYSAQITKTEYNAFNDALYGDDDKQLSMQLSLKHLKQKVMETNKMGEEIVIQKNGPDDLQIIVDKSTTVQYDSTYCDATKINLFSNLDKDDIIRVNISLDIVGPISKVSSIGGVDIIILPEKSIVVFILEFDKKEVGCATKLYLSCVVAK